jgi:5'-methylthioadenosine phosphorylase
MDGRIGIIGGTSLVGHAKELELEKFEVETSFGHASSPLLVGQWNGREVALLVRHGLDHHIPPHRLNHHANVEALIAAGVEKLVLIASAGSLSDDLAPPAVVLADDFASPFNVPTFFDDNIVHITPSLSAPMRALLMSAATEVGVQVVDGGTYVQTLGPRLETRAEVRVLQTWGDLVGMTLASEATLALERKMEVAAICSVDNMAHGIGDGNLEFEAIMANAVRNWKEIERLLMAAVPKL